MIGCNDRARRSDETTGHVLVITEALRESSSDENTHGCGGESMICLSMRSNLQRWALQTIGSTAILLLNMLPTTALFAAPIPITKVQRAEPVVFEKEILPMLQRSCLACHNASKKDRKSTRLNSSHT